MITQFIYRTGVPLVDLFFNSFAAMIEMQRAFVSGGMMTAPVSSKPKAPIQPQGDIARQTSAKQEVRIASETGAKVKDQKKVQVHPEVRRARRIRAAPGKNSRELAGVQNLEKRKNTPTVATRKPAAHRN
jgi:hypothetical protein